MDSILNKNIFVASLSTSCETCILNRGAITPKGARSGLKGGNVAPAILYFPPKDHIVKKINIEISMVLKS